METNVQKTKKKKMTREEFIERTVEYQEARRLREMQAEQDVLNYFYSKNMKYLRRINGKS